MKSHAVVMISIAACACSAVPESRSTGNVELVASIRAVGFECGEPVGAAEIADDWVRIRCANAEPFVAYKSDDGRVCIEPVIIGDTDIPSAAVMPEPRCTSEWPVSAVFQRRTQ